MGSWWESGEHGGGTLRACRANQAWTQVGPWLFTADVTLGSHMNSLGLGTREESVR